MTEMVKKTRKHIPAILLAVSLLLAGVMTAKVMAYAASSMAISARIANAVGAVNCEDEELKVYTAKYVDLAGELKKKSVFAPPPKKKNPVKEVVAIFGKEAFINGKWYKVGDKIGKAELIAIEPTHIVVKFDGKESKIAPIARPTEYKTPEKKPEKKEGSVEKTDEPVEQEAAVAQEAESTVDDPLAWIGVKLSPALRAKFLEKWNSMSDEEKEKTKEQWSKMSQEEKEQAVEQMEQNM